jgi:hypothetical protein
MQVLREMSEKQPHFRWLIASGLFSLVMLVAIVTVAMGEPAQVPLPDLHPSDWVLAIAGGLAIPATMLTYWGLQFLPQPQPRLQAPVQEVAQRPIIYNGTSPEVVNRLKAERDALQKQLDARPEPERALTYRAVIALLRAGNVGIKYGKEMVRANGGVVGRDDSELKALLALLPSPTDAGSPIHAQKQAVNREPEGVNQPVNRRAMGRSQPRKGRR